MGAPARRQGLSLAQQYFLLRHSSPLPGQGGVKNGMLNWTYVARPSPVGRLYTLILRLKQGDFPSVTVRSPDLNALAQGKKLPHTYKDAPPELCLFHPSKGEWRSTYKLVDTIIPWSIEWLHYFEVWLRTGEWVGGGEHPTSAA